MGRQSAVQRAASTEHPAATAATAEHPAATAAADEEGGGGVQLAQHCQALPCRTFQV